MMRSLNKIVGMIYPSVCRNIPLDLKWTIEPGVGHIGDLVAVQVEESEIIPKVELACGRMRRVYDGEVLLAALGPRWAPKEYCGTVSTDGIRFFEQGGTDCMLSLLVDSGIVGVCTSRASGIPKPISIRSKGLLSSGGKTLNLKDFSIITCEPLSTLPPLIVVVGTAMEVGKTACAGTCINGFSKRGFKIAAAKLTGIASVRDLLVYSDAGAVGVYDFLDAGIPITLHRNGMPLIAKKIIHQLLVDYRPDLVIIELAASILLPANEALLNDPDIKKAISAVILAAGDEVGAVGGVNILRRSYGITPHAVTGLVCNTEAGVKYVKDAVQLPAFSWREEMHLIDVLEQSLPKKLIKGIHR